jgi:hypothetical protein
MIMKKLFTTWTSAFALLLGLSCASVVHAASGIFPMTGTLDMEIHLDVAVTSGDGLSVTIDGHESVSRGMIASSKGKATFVAPYTPVPGNPKGSGVSIPFPDIAMTDPVVHARIIVGSESSNTMSWQSSDGEVSLDPLAPNGSAMLVRGSANKTRVFTLDKVCGGLFIIGVRGIFPTGASLELTFVEGSSQATRTVPLIGAGAALWTQLSAPVETDANGSVKWAITADSSATSSKIDCRSIPLVQ